MDNKKAWLALISICLIWGTTYLFLKIGVTEAPPFLFSAIRQTIAGLLLLFILSMTIKIGKLPKKYILNQSLAGLLMITAGNGLVAYGEVVIPSGMAAVICASMPVWVALINVFVHSKTKLTVIGYGAIAIGLGGILLLFSDSILYFKDEKYMWGAFLTLVATFAWIFGSLMIKNNSQGQSPFLSAAIQMFTGGIGLFIVSLITEPDWNLNLTFNGYFSLIYLTLIGSIFAMVAYSYALKHLSFQTVSVYAYINPIVALILGWLVLNERITGMSLVACMIIILGVVLLNLPISKKKMDLHPTTN